MEKDNLELIAEFENIIGYKFKNKKWIMEALTHSSYSNENKKKNLTNNERLEFLGDAILDLIISEYLFNLYPDLPEGELTKLRASIVCELSLSTVANKYNFGKYLFLGKGEELTGGRERPSILADAFEAILSAVYIDGKMESAVDFIKRILIPSIKNNQAFRDYKTMLQEEIQKSSHEPIEYSIISESGPDHDKEFFVEVKHSNVTLGKGKGKSKKEAEQNAAYNALNAYQDKKEK